MTCKLCKFMFIMTNTDATIVNIDHLGFARFLSLKGCRTPTIARHLRTLRLLEKQTPQMDYESVKKHLDDKKVSGTSGSSLNNVVTTVRLYAKSIGDEKLAKIPLYPRHQVGIRRTLSDAQIEAFLAVPVRKWQSTSSWRQWNVFWYLVAFTGIRLQEVKKEEHLDNFGVYSDNRFSPEFKKKLKDLFFEEKQKLIA